LCFAKDKSKLTINRQKIKDGSLREYRYNDKDGKGIYRLCGCWARGYQKGCEYEFVDKKGRVFKKRGYLMNKKTMESLDKDNYLVVHGNNIYRKLYLAEHKGRLPETVWDISNAANATEELKNIMNGKCPFTSPKPLELIKEILIISSKKNSIVLDFFAGSGTTGHAVMDLNRIDGGSRKFIMCDINEKTLSTPNGIVNDVTSKRLKRIMSGHCYDGSLNYKWLEQNKPYYDNLYVFDVSEKK
jgi:adenine-specific DNA-methyltransferase